MWEEYLKNHKLTWWQKRMLLRKIRKEAKKLLGAK